MSPHPVIPPLTITTHGIQKLLNNINPHKASGPDNISVRILKDLQNFTAPILTIIFQKSFQTGCIPSDWKHANVAPAYKQGEKYNAVRDRPFNLKGGMGGYGFLFRSEFCFRTTQEVEYYFFLSRKARFFFPEFNIRLYDKNSETDYIFFPPPKSEYFFSNIGNQNIFLEKKHTPPPFQVKWSFPKLQTNLSHLYQL